MAWVEMCTTSVTAQGEPLTFSTWEEDGSCEHEDTVVGEAPLFKHGAATYREYRCAKCGRPVMQRVQEA